MAQPVKKPGRVHIPEITSSLKTLFVLRTIISIGLIVAGISVLLIGSQMLLTSLGSGNENILFEIAGSVKITAGGFGAVVMATSIIPFVFAYKARPTFHLIPTNGGGFSLSSENADGLSEISSSADTDKSSVSASEMRDVGLSSEENNFALRKDNIEKTAYSSAVYELKRAV